MMYCKDCKFYKYDSIDEIWNDNYSKVLKEIVRGECYNEKFRFDYNLKEDDEFVYYDSEFYKGGFYVGEEFGCIHFKRKEGIQKLLKDIETDFKALYSVLNIWKEISEIKWKKKNKLNINQTMFMRRECDQLVYDCKKLLEEIEIHESKRVD